MNQEIEIELRNRGAELIRFGMPNFVRTKLGIPVGLKPLLKLGGFITYRADVALIVTKTSPFD